MKTQGVKTYQAGDLDRMLTFLKPSDITTAYGVVTHYDPEAEETACGLLASGGNESEDDKGVVGKQTNQFLTRYRSDVLQTWRFLFEGATYEVVSNEEGPGRRQWSLISAKRTDLTNTTS